MKMVKYELVKESVHGYKETVDKARAELKKEGFGVLTEIDVKKTLKKKLDKDFDNYIILGACNPPFAFQALQEEREIGLLLPCNVIIYDKQEKTYVSAVRPTVAMQMTDNPALKEVAEQVEEKLKKVIEEV